MAFHWSLLFDPARLVVVNAGLPHVVARLVLANSCAIQNRMNRRNVAKLGKALDKLSKKPRYRRVTHLTILPSPSPAVAVAVACSPRRTPPQTYVISTEGGALCRRSGETPVFRFCLCRCLFSSTNLKRPGAPSFAALGEGWDVQSSDLFAVAVALAVAFAVASEIGPDFSPGTKEPPQNRASAPWICPLSSSYNPGCPMSDGFTSDVGLLH